MNKYIVTLALVLIALTSMTASYIPCSNCRYGKTGGHGDHLGGGGGGGHADGHIPNHAFGNERVRGYDNAHGHGYDNDYDNEHYYNSHRAGHDQHHGGYRTHGY